MNAAVRFPSFELGPIRPPSEAYSLLIRVTRNCPWNRCLFCSTYKGSRFELRPVEEVKHDILSARAIAERMSGTERTPGPAREAAAEFFSPAFGEAERNVALWMYAGGSSAFLQDANSLIVRTSELAEMIRFLKEQLPSITRVTSYARSKTAARKSPDELLSLKEAGLSRLHIGLESGCDAVLSYVDKGATAADHITGGRKVVEAGITLSEYVIPGLGGRLRRRENAAGTARVLSAIGPDFIRLRSLTLRQGMPLFEKAQKGEFEAPSEDEVVEEIGWLIDGLHCSSEIKSDHMMNLLPEIEGRLPRDKERLLGIIAAYLSLPERERLGYRLGRRSGYYHCLSDMDDPGRRESVDRLLRQLDSRGKGAAESALDELRASQGL